LSELKKIEFPDGENVSDAINRYRTKIVESEMIDGSPFDTPQPPVKFSGKKFVFTGKFSFGTRKDCQKVVKEKGGEAASRGQVGSTIDYLVIGTEGSKDWNRGSYGSKIEAAIISRKNHGTPAIISEEHWIKYLEFS
jgi:NAD-dependent DNA ligase